MGFAFPKMREKLPALSAAVLLGLLWGLWHVPVIDDLGTATPHGHYWFPSFLAFTAAMTATRVLIAWLYSNTKSVLLAQLMHACYTARWSPSARPVSPPPKKYSATPSTPSLYGSSSPSSHSPSAPKLSDRLRNNRIGPEPYWGVGASAPTQPLTPAQPSGGVHADPVGRLCPRSLIQLDHFPRRVASLHQGTKGISREGKERKPSA
jgi:hypothetical protein